LEKDSRSRTFPALTLDTTAVKGAEPLVATVSNAGDGFALKVARFKQ
jgi:hypothetical protein